MELSSTADLFSLSAGDVVSKRNLFDLIQFSKVPSSRFWSGAESKIGNTPQQGINWIGQAPDIRAVIVKTRPGSYKDDGWASDRRESYRYSFKATKGRISYTEKANDVLVHQPQHLYPIFAFTDQGDNWLFEGTFSVVGIEDTYVVLKRGQQGIADLANPLTERHFKEGGRKYVTHLLAERSRNAVKVLKDVRKWVCDVCGETFSTRYGVEYIEAHHKAPISTYTAERTVTASDFALLCPNCHAAVHIYMRQEGLEYEEIKSRLCELAT